MISSIKYFVYQICWCFLFFMPIVQAGTSAEDFFISGVEKFKQGSYDDALIYFRNAKHNGYESAQLFHNLGVVYLKLGQLNKARENFIQTLRYPSIESLGHYNLGLVDLDQGNYGDAKARFKKVVQRGGNPALVALARKRLLQKNLSKIDIKNWTVLARIGKGYDDNVNFTPDDLDSNVDDAYTELLVYGSIMLTEKKPMGVGIDAYVYGVNYDDVNANNFTQTSFLLKFPMQYNKWKIQPGITAQWLQYGGDGYQRINGFELKSKYFKSTSTQYLAKYTYEKMDSLAERFNFLEGSRQRLRLEHQYKQNAYKTKFYYELEVNNRTDRISQSYSPRRHSLSGSLSYEVNDSLSMNGNLKYRSSDYPTVNSYDRDDKQLQASWGGQFKLNKYTALKGQHTWVKKNSSDSRRDYDRHRVVFSIQLDY